MRSLVLIALLLVAAPAAAAPTCLTGHGMTIRCGAPGAMPVGWRPSPEQWKEWRRNAPPVDKMLLVKLALGLGLFFAMIALMPEFDGASDKDWLPEQDDRPREGRGKTGGRS